MSKASAQKWYERWRRKNRKYVNAYKRRMTQKRRGDYAGASLVTDEKHRVAAPR